MHTSERDLVFNHNACRFLERLLNEYSLILIDSLLAPPSLLLTKATSLELAVLLPARCSRSQRLAKLSNTLLQILSHHGDAVRLQDYQLPSPATRDALLHLVATTANSIWGRSQKTDNCSQTRARMPASKLMEATGDAGSTSGSASFCQPARELDERQLDELFRSLTRGEFALVHFGEELMLYRKRLTISLSWQADGTTESS